MEGNTSVFANLDFSAITTAVTTIVPQVIVPILTVQASLIGIKIMKKLTNKIGS